MEATGSGAMMFISCCSLHKESQGGKLCTVGACQDERRSQLSTRVLTDPLSQLVSISRQRHLFRRARALLSRRQNRRLDALLLCRGYN